MRRMRHQAWDDSRFNHINDCQSLIRIPRAACTLKLKRGRLVRLETEFTITVYHSPRLLRLVGMSCDVRSQKPVLMTGAVGTGLFKLTRFVSIYREICGNKNSASAVLLKLSKVTTEMG
ncbi:hypothetical protein EVAR_15946_1 [Eumeta japonica]|uniref:Uncharacterized protein n=1 Tax=Eumeta variegata TaxID=151549 RepID=A0A4C1UL21_EUMVA|nr:hypothetical protein EVAR_15946_1 [Eumeta japonica]